MINEEYKELKRQTESVWKRGRDFGLFWGITGSILAFIIIGLIWKLV